MTTSYRRFLLAMSAAAAGLVLTAASAGGVAAADSVHAGVGTSQAALHSSVAWTAPSGNGNNGNGNGNGGNGNGNGGQGGGTATPELPSGVLFGIGALPLLAGLFLVWRRTRRVVQL